MIKINFVNCTVPCLIPQIDNAAFKYKSEAVSQQEEIPHGEAVEFGCAAGYVVQGPEMLRCSYGKWSPVQKFECVPGSKKKTEIQIQNNPDVFPLKLPTVRSSL